MNKEQLESKDLQFLDEYVQLCEKYQLMLFPMTIKNLMYVKPLKSIKPFKEGVFELVSKNMKEDEQISEFSKDEVINE